MTRTQPDPSTEAWVAALAEALRVPVPEDREPAAVEPATNTDRLASRRTCMRRERHSASGAPSSSPRDLL